MSTPAIPTPAAKIEDRLLLMPIIQPFKKTWLRKKTFAKAFPFITNKLVHDPVQGCGYHLGFSVKNIGDNPFPGGSITNIQFIDPSGRTVVNTSQKSAAIRMLNPGESEDITIEKWTPSAGGLLRLRCDVNPNDSSTREIQTYTRDMGTDAIDEVIPNKNIWTNHVYVEKRADALQARTNLILVILTILTFVQGAFGLDKIWSGLISILHTVFLTLANLIHN
ncbi:MAG TPA: hypothetical protein VGT99_05860 [Gammaproteobacteria bacterium]|nr:hypothetical protein [Gammaproteobacteria bacterium]